MKFYPRSDWDINQPQDLGASDCSFCNTDSLHASDYIIWEGKYWFICHNKYPVLGLETQIMAIPKRHVKMAYQLNDNEMLEYPTVEKFVYDFYKGGSYFTFMRESLQNRSMEHIHYHFLPGKINYKHLEYILLDQGFTDQSGEE